MTDNTDTDAQAAEIVVILREKLPSIAGLERAADLIDTLRAQVADLTAKLEKVEKWAQGEVIAVLDREAATTARYDAKLDALEAEIARWKEQSDDWQKRGWELGKKCDALEAREARQRRALELIEYQSTNHGGWFDQPGQQFAEYCKLGTIARTALESGNDG